MLGFVGAKCVITGTNEVGGQIILKNEIVFIIVRVKIAVEVWTAQMLGHGQPFSCGYIVHSCMIS